MDTIRLNGIVVNMAGSYNAIYILREHREFLIIGRVFIWPCIMDTDCLSTDAIVTATSRFQSGTDLHSEG